MLLQTLKNLVKPALSAHSWLGLMLGAVMYAICLTGTLAVFFEEIERWEQPLAASYSELDPVAAETGFQRWFASMEAPEDHLYLVFPSTALPMMKVADSQASYYLNADGTMGERAYDDFSHLITGLHINLHLPERLGLIIVSAAGALLVGLIISGFLAHPSILRDAFRLRSGGSYRLRQVDIHNRLSVWAAPFHLMIAVTGAYFGGALLVMGLYAQVFYDGDQQQIIEQAFGAEPELVQTVRMPEIAKAYGQLAELSPGGEPLFMILHDAGTETAFMEFFVRQPERLIYSENYVFNLAGNFIQRDGFLDGPAAKQIVYSVYRLHFGHFGGVAVKFLYVVLGLALTVVSVTGINIWLAKRGRADALDRLWAGFVWGLPLALTLSAPVQVLLHGPGEWVFWLSLLCLCIWARWQIEPAQIRRRYQLGTGLALLFLLLSYGLHFGASAFQGVTLAVNIALLLLALFFLRAALPSAAHGAGLVPADIVSAGRE
ncbi:PepSY-associated TM helix domain-containing protein [Simiduia litorea]|uniref:PepSY-associated TM helix domain-containing protein n=1 Tax=Simiduia litorea TaxID=1435348 RepID=UPI0036F2FA25